MQRQNSVFNGLKHIVLISERSGTRARDLEILFLSARVYSKGALWVTLWL